MTRRRGRRTALAAGAALATGAVLWTALAGPSRLPQALPPHPARTYEEALDRFEGLAKRDGPEVNPACRSRLMTHGSRVGRAVVLLHGFTNCPKQFDRIGSMLHAAGANVLLPRLPRHGLRDRMTEELVRLTGSELLAASAEAVDVAHGLGDTVVVVGLSSTAVTAAALAQGRSDLDRAVLLAPALAPKDVPASVARRLATLLIHAPNRFAWWNSKEKESLPGPAQCYPRFPTRALGEIYRLGSLVFLTSGRERPAARSIAIVTTAADRAVGNGVIASLAARWRARGADVSEYQYAESLGVQHDMIDPEQVDARVDVAYPVVTALALGRPLP